MEKRDCSRCGKEYPIGWFVESGRCRMCEETIQGNRPRTRSFNPDELIKVAKPSKRMSCNKCGGEFREKDLRKGVCFVCLRKPWAELPSRLRSKPEPLPKYRPDMYWQEYEKYCRDVLIACGWDAHIPTNGSDFGADVIAKKESTKVVIQCKKYGGGRKVGVDAVHGAKAYYKADSAIVVTNSAYTKQAIHKANRIGIRLLNHDHLKRL